MAATGLRGAEERFLIDSEADAPAPAPATAASIAALFADAAGHAADALPELLVLARGGESLAVRLRPYLNEVTHCLASALEAALIASQDAERAGIGAARPCGEDALAGALVAFLDGRAG